MTIASLELKHGIPFDCVCRVCQPRWRTAQNGSQYMTLSLEDATGAIKAYVWTENLKIDFKEYDLVKARGTIRSFNGSWIASLQNADLVKDVRTNPVALLPQSICPLPALLARLDALPRGIKNRGLYRFVSDVLADDAISFPFVSLPASRKHHHCTAGGLLEHSLECTAMVGRFAEFPQAELELALVGALFHDIGKIRTLKDVGKLAPTGYVCGHESLTLEVLAPHLRTLDANCPDASLALRYIWTWQNQRRRQRPTPLLTIIEAISAADRISSGLNAQDAAFSGQPDWRSFAGFGDNNMFWRPRLAMQQ